MRLYKYLTNTFSVCLECLCDKSSESIGTGIQYWGVKDTRSVVLMLSSALSSAQTNQY